MSERPYGRRRRRCCGGMSRDVAARRAGEDEIRIPWRNGDCGDRGGKRRAGRLPRSCPVLGAPEATPADPQSSAFIWIDHEGRDEQKARIVQAGGRILKTLSTIDRAAEMSEL